MLEVVGVRPVQEHPQEQVVVGEPFANGRQQQRHGLQAEPVELVQEACGDFTPTIPLESKCKYYNNNNKIKRWSYLLGISLTQYMLVLNALLICTFNLQRPSTRVGHVAAIHRLCFHATYMGKI